ncbi:Rne/Rng family ribonuclease [Streptomyces sp. NPDC127092]|uniref:Rne/Rng family ribonuclease n=1 Tax=Streptomyces sp. NPDC127092 TaxID=3347135 RepID=UPI0036556DB1
MLEQPEENENNAPGDKLPPRRRRRAASRPAGPPVTAGSTDTAETAAEAAEAPAPVTETPAEEPAPARPRRRATRKATAPAPEPVQAEAEVPAEEPAAEPAPAAAEPVAEEAAPARRTRRRATRAVTSPEPVVQAEAETPAEEPAAEAPAAEAPAAETAPAPRTRRRATRKTGAPEVTPDVAAELAAESSGEALPADTVEEIASHAVEVAAAEQAATRGRSRRRATSPQFTAEPSEAEEAPRSRRATRPAVAVFQAPVFTEPMFQTPETAAAMAAAEATEEEPEEETAEAVETVEAVEAEESPRARRRRRRRAEPVAVEPVPATVADEPEVESTPEAEAEAEAEEGDEYEDRPSRRRRRGGRRRRRGELAEVEETEEEGEEYHAEEAEAEGEEEPEEAEEAEAAGSSSSRRRRRRRRRSGDAAGEPETTDEDGVRTVVKVREPRPAREKAEPSDEVQSIKGSTRLEAKKQRRREGREQGRRRVPIITEAEFLARREAVERVMVVRQNGERTQIGVLEDNVLVEHYVNKEQATSYVGNVYLGKVQNVLPSMEAAFVDIGKGRNAVLYAGEVNFEALGMANGPRRIESALKSGQSVLVQVTKDPIGHKGARLTSQVSLPGRYLVYVPEGSMTGISRKLPDTERARLKTILKKIVPEDAGVIVRTAAEGASEDELRRDVERLQAQWEDIQKKAKNGNAPTLLYGEPDMTVRVVRDIFNEDFSKVIVSGDDAWETIHGYVSHVAPDLTDRLSKWTSEVDVFATYRIDEQLMKALDRKVWLPSGGSLVIDKTEAMVVVDVNTGKFTGQGGNLEETVTRNNLEAAEEIVRQLRLRDLGGIVVIDFIDMVLESNRDLVLRRLLECLGRDRTKHQVAEVTSLGLVQMTRKRVGQGLLESFSETCVHCNGRGVIVHMEQPATHGGGGGGKRAKKRGRGGDVHEHAHEAVETPAETHEAPAEQVETAAEVAAELAAPVALPEAIAPDEELYGSVAEAEAAAARGRGRRRATRRVSAPAASPAVTETETFEVVVPEPKAKAEEKPRTEAPAPVAEAPAAEPAVEEAPAPRTRRRATRKATAPVTATAEPAAEPVAETVVETAVVEEPPAVAEAPVVEPAVEEAPVAAPPRARRRVVRKATAPAGSPSGSEPAEEAAEASAPAAKKAARKTAKKATAKKAATKKTAAKKTAAKKTTAKKAAAKKTAAPAQD